MPTSNDQIVAAIDRRMGSFNTLYALSGATILIMILLSIIGFFSVSRTNSILEEFVMEVKLNSKDRENNALMALALKDLTNSVKTLENQLSNFIIQQTRTNENQTEFNNIHSGVLKDAGNYINQHPIELLRKGK